MLFVKCLDFFREFPHILIVSDFRDIIKSRIAKLGWKTIEQAAEKIGVHAEYFRQILRGARNPPSDDILVKVAHGLWKGDPDRDARTFELLALAAEERAKDQATKDIWHDALGKSLVESVTGSTRPKGRTLAERVAADALEESPAIMMPVVGRVPAGKPMEAIEDHEPNPVPIPRELLRGRENRVFLLRVRGKSMMPTIMEGDIVLVEKDVAVANGEVVVVRKDLEGSVTLKRFYAQGSTVMLKPDNPGFEPLPDFLDKPKILPKLVIPTHASHGLSPIFPPFNATELPGPEPGFVLRGHRSAGIDHEQVGFARDHAREQPHGRIALRHVEKAITVQVGEPKPDE